MLVFWVVSELLHVYYLTLQNNAVINYANSVTSISCHHMNLLDLGDYILSLGAHTFEATDYAPTSLGRNMLYFYGKINP